MIAVEIDAIFEGQGFLITNFTDVEEVSGNIKNLGTTLKTI